MLVQDCTIKGFDEQSITGRSGHRSTAARSYKCPSEDLLQIISNALQPPKPKERKPFPKKEWDTEHSPQTVEQTPTDSE